MKYRRPSSDGEAGGEFDYRFDYVLMPLATVRLEDAARDVGVDGMAYDRMLQARGYNVFIRRGERYVEDYPQGAPAVLELMTCSTSGGNKAKRTQIAQAFEDCVVNGFHQAPGINQRQVVGRMVTQLIVKSQAALHWGGRAIWLLQDKLADYISSSTALDLEALSSEHVSEINMMTFGYSSARAVDLGATAALSPRGLYSDLVHDDAGAAPTFRDMLLGSVFPPRSALIRKLVDTDMHSVFTYEQGVV